MCGLPATGKTTVAEKLAHNLKAQVLNTDLIRETIFLKGSKADVDKCKTDEEKMKYDLQEIFDRNPPIPPKYQSLIVGQREIIYQKLFERVESLLAKGNIILDGTFSKMRWRRETYKIARKHSTGFYLIYCICSEDIVSKRLEDRRHKKSGISEVTTMDVFYLVKASFEDPLGDDIPTLVYHSDNRDIEFNGMQNSEELDVLAKSIRSIAVQHSQKPNRNIFLPYP